LRYGNSSSPRTAEKVADFGQALDAVMGLVGFAFACMVLHVSAVPLGAPIGLTLALSTSLGWGLLVFGLRRRGITL